MYVFVARYFSHTAPDVNMKTCDLLAFKYVLRDYGAIANRKTGLYMLSVYKDVSYNF